ncbi:nuclear transport factor 2 family protein [Myxococcota bacterium]|nr:nuclear transport factor 2 family protein [Myxococcota bacterium]MBU1431335.1 nuclear transport factor 2 family protein [Myxococcota bacterium]MBU1900271.1 nuclear transport factor 2 family protein [Myxococcota bacterium]
MRIIPLTLALLLSACGPRFVKGTEIEYSQERQALADMVERYRVALVGRDVQTLKSMVSEGYYENGSTTSDPTDDYNVAGLHKLLSDLETKVQEVKYKIKITSIEVYDKLATVDYEYEGQYAFLSRGAPRWATATDKNRLTFRREQGNWRIVSGL